MPCTQKVVDFRIKFLSHSILVYSSISCRDRNKKKDGPLGPPKGDVMKKRERDKKGENM